MAIEIETHTEAIRQVLSDLAERVFRTACSFCGRAHGELVQGMGGAFICTACVQSFHSRQRRKRRESFVGS